MEHRDLKLSQFKRVHNPEGYIYTEFSSKNRPGGFKNLEVSHKSVPIYAVPNVDIHCHVYLQHHQILESRGITRHQWEKTYCPQCLKICAYFAGVEGNKTNHSLRATGATELFSAGVPEKIIQQRTGHRSTKALRVYERTTLEQHQAVSNILSYSKQSFNNEIQVVQSQNQTSSSTISVSPLPVVTPPTTRMASERSVFNNCTFNITVPSVPQSNLLSPGLLEGIDMDELFKFD